MDFGRFLIERLNLFKLNSGTNLSLTFVCWSASRLCHVKKSSRRVHALVKNKSWETQSYTPDPKSGWFFNRVFREYS